MNRKNYFIIGFIVILLVLMGCIGPTPTKEPVVENISDNKTVIEKEEIKQEIKLVREPVVSGTFYPGSKADLDSMVTQFLDSAEKKNIGNIRGLVSPHAGYIYSGGVAAEGYKQLDEDIKTVIILAPSHRFYFKGASIANVSHYKTPLGEIKLSSKVKEILKEKNIVSEGNAHTQEHSLEVQLPFLQKKLHSFEIIPIVTGDVNPYELGETLMTYIDDDTLIVASSDLSHYHPYDEAVELDRICTDAITNLDFESMKGCEACGEIPVLTLMYIADKSGWRGYFIDYKNSGDTAGDKSGVVGYASIAFYDGVNKEEQKFLLNLSRETLEGYLRNGSLPKVSKEGLSDRLSDRLLEQKGCFVTLKKNKELRGCIGHIIPQESLYECVMENAVNAAVNDRRFLPVKYGELKDIEIEISILSVPKELKHNSPEDLLNKLTHKDGVILRSGMHQSTYLPQVWEQIPNKEQFLSSLCVKGGAAPECWKDKNTTIFTYRAYVFMEE